MERIEMSQEERDKLEWLKRAKDGVISQRATGQAARHRVERRDAARMDDRSRIVEALERRAKAPPFGLSMRGSS